MIRAYFRKLRTQFEVATLQLEAQRHDLTGRLAIHNQTPLSSITRGSEMFDSLTGGVSASGAVVNDRTAMCVSAVYGCVRLIAGAIATLPAPIYRHTEDGRERAKHPLHALLNMQPSAAMSAAVFWEYIVTSILLPGDGFALIIRSDDRAINSGDVLGIEPVHARRVEVRQVEGRLKYTIASDQAKPLVFDQDDVLHFPGIGFDGLRSLSPIQYAARQAIGIALAADEYSARFFSNGARPDVVLEIPGILDEDQITLLRAKWVDRYGGLANSRAPAILAGGMKMHELTINAEDAQLIATRQFQVGDIARVYGVPAWMIGEMEKQSSWGTGIEQTGIGFVKYTLGPHLTRIEQELNRKLFRDGRFFVEFNRDGLMEGDSKAQAEYFTKALGGPGAQGWLSVNEVRRLKNMPPKKDFDDIPRAGAVKPTGAEA